MSANITDKITDVRNSARPVTASVTGTRSAGGTTLGCDSLTGWPDTTKSKVHFVTYRIDSNSNPVAGTQLDCYGIVSGASINSFTVVDGNDVGNAVGDKVEMLPTAAWGQDLADALTSQHSRTGAHVGVSNTGGMTNTGGLTTDTLVVSSGSTLPAGDIITADIADKAVTSRKVAPTLILKRGTSTTIGAVVTDVAGATATFTPAIAGTAKVTAFFEFGSFTNAGDVFVGTLNVDGSDITGSVPIQAPTGGTDVTVGQQWLVAVTAAAHTFKLRAQRTGGVGSAGSSPNGNTSMLIELMGADNVTYS